MRQPHRTVTLLSDFGCRDPYVGAMRGAVLSVCPNARLVDLTHEVAPHDVLEGAYALASACAEFPPGTIHLAVVDPGVGGERRPLVATTARYHFVGPDNGLLSLALTRERRVVVREIQSREYLHPSVSPTFHGRDLFAPVAGWLARGLAPARLGPRLASCRTSLVREPTRLRDGSVRGSVLHIDRFGNVISNIERSSLPPAFLERGVLICRARLGGHEITHRASHYAAAPSGRPFLLVNSLGFVEVALREASLAERWSVRRGDPLRLLPPGGSRRV
jgi:hypothetical protein